MQVLIVDDEPLARQRLTQLLSRLADPVKVLVEFADAGSAFQWLQTNPGQASICFLDIQMPGPDGLHLADKISSMSQPPLVVFVTAHPEHACHAFDLQVSDYLTKPVRLERLEQTVVRCRKLLGTDQTKQADVVGELLIQERLRLIRIAYQDILYLKAELKYVHVRTVNNQYWINDSLNELEKKLGSAFIRIHRNALVAKTSMKKLERSDHPQAGEGWSVQIDLTNEWLQVSRRQVALVRENLLKP